MSDDPLVLAWAAGLFEGEGSAGVITPKRQKPYGFLSLAMTDKETVFRFQKAVGFGTINYCPSPSIKWKPTWKWQSRKRTDIQWFVERLYPLLSSRRREQLDRALAAAVESARSRDTSLVRTMYGKRVRDLSPEELLTYRRAYKVIWKQRQQTIGSVVNG